MGTSRRRSVAVVTSLMAAGCLVAGLSEPVAVAAPPAAAPPVRAVALAAATSQNALADTVSVDPKAKLTFSPVAYSAGGGVAATFAKPNIVAKRPVSLQYRSASGWVEVKTATMSSSGNAVFKVTPDAAAVYRAVADRYSYKVKKKKKVAAIVATPTDRLSAEWTTSLTDDFTGASTKWESTLEGNYNTGERWCSAAYASNWTISDGVARLTMSKDTNEAHKASANKAAKANQKKAKRKQVGCPNGVYKNARVSTEGGRFSIKTGIVAARITFPKNQGMHGGVWLQSGAGSELDMVEAFGYGKGIQNVLHVKGKDYPGKEAQKWVAGSTMKKSSWWSASHVFSIEWTRSTVIWRLDGVTTKQISRLKLPDTNYFLVMSMLSSDWELGRLKKPVNPHHTKGVKALPLPATMKVDWVKAWVRS